MSNQSMQGVAAAAAIGQERIVRTVTFAITGDFETDFIAGIMAVFFPNEGPTPSPDNALCLRVCKYLANRFEDNIKAIEKQGRAMQQVQGIGHGVGTTSFPPWQQPCITSSGALPYSIGTGAPTGKTLAEIFMEQKAARMMQDKKVWDDTAKESLGP